jgi:hypothetical protein
MRTSRGLALALVVVASGLAFGAGCDKKKGKDKPAPAAADAAVAAPAKTPDAAVAAPPTTTTATGTEPGVNNMMHCPSAVEGSKTTITKGKDAVVVEISGEGDEMLSEIRSRAKHLTDVQAAPDSKVEHTGKGTGGSTAGVCPVVTKDTTIEVAEAAAGVTVTMKPTAPLTVDALEADAQKRLTDLTAKMAEPKTGAGTGGTTDDGTGKGKGTGGGGGKGTGGGSDNTM